MKLKALYQSPKDEGEYDRVIKDYKNKPAFILHHITIKKRKQKRRIASIPI